MSKLKKKIATILPLFCFPSNTLDIFFSFLNGSVRQPYIFFHLLLLFLKPSVLLLLLLLFFPSSPSWSFCLSIWFGMLFVDVLLPIQDEALCDVLRSMFDILGSLLFFFFGAATIGVDTVV